MKTEFKVLGIDVSKAKITTHILSCFPAVGIKNYWNKTRNKSASYPTFYTFIPKKKSYKNAFDFAAYVKEMSPNYAILEPTGNHYSRIWYQILQSLEIKVLWVGHVELKRYRAGKLLPNKSDAVDALAMAAYVLDPEHLTESGEINLKFYLIHQPDLINQLRDLCQQLEHKCTGSISNNQLFPSVAFVAVPRSCSSKIYYNKAGECTAALGVVGKACDRTSAANYFR